MKIKENPNTNTVSQIYGAGIKLNEFSYNSAEKIDSKKFKKISESFIVKNKELLKVEFNELKIKK